MSTETVKDEKIMSTEVIRDNLKYGFTTGSAACAATKAALFMLTNNTYVDTVRIDTPAGIIYSPDILEQKIHRTDSNRISVGDYASCAVVKESGDDPDITNGIRIVSKVTVIKEKDIVITGGIGVGRVTRPGLDQRIGEYAINSVPRRMIKEAASEYIAKADFEYGVCVEISVPEGEEIAKKTFNPHMGIEGGISIIGTTGIVKPMSSEALLETIRLDIAMQFAEGHETCVIVPGNYGVTFLTNNYGIDEKDIVLCSNYVGDSFNMAVKQGFKKILFCSHIGKMIKVSGGVMNTHSSFGDRRMEFMCDAFLEACEVDINHVTDKIMNCVSTTAALDILNEIGMVDAVSKAIIRRTLLHLNDVCKGKAEIDVILYENKYGELARSF